MIDGLLEAIADFHRTRAVDEPVAISAMARRIVDALDSLLADRGQTDESTPVHSFPLPVLTHVTAIDTTTGDPRVDAILTEFVSLADQLPWTQTAGYLDRLPQTYLDNYGYVRLVGPNAIIEHDSVMIGIGVWGPGLDYPMHEHEAEELYDVLHGSPMFRTDTSEFAVRPPGSSVHHPPWTRHAQRFGDESTVLLYAWTGAITTDAVLVD